jgi:hypothetical protein
MMHRPLNVKFKVAAVFTVEVRIVLKTETMWQSTSTVKTYGLLTLTIKVCCIVSMFLDVN